MLLHNSCKHLRSRFEDFWNPSESLTHFASDIKISYIWFRSHVRFNHSGAKHESRGWDVGTATFGLSEFYSFPWTLYVSSPTFSPCLMKDLDVSFVLLKHKTSGNQIWGILTLFAEKVQTEFLFFSVSRAPEITRGCLSCAQMLWFHSDV